MDPQSVSFTPQSDVWRLSMAETIRIMQATQHEHSERLARLERRQNGDAKVKSVWGGSSPFPVTLNGTPQIGPQLGSNVDFNDFDIEESPNNMVRSLHLDTDDEPRRTTASRANSVRFDESAKWNHGSRSSVDLLSRTPSNLGGLGGHPMFERTASHKSDGRQSSTGQSASGRANSLGLESSQILGQSSTDLSGMNPGLAILGTVPSIIRCWLDMDFKHDSLLYAAICTGSYRSSLDSRLIGQLGLSGQIRQDVSGNSKIRLSVYLPEAVSHPASSRPNSPVPQLPSVTVDFMVVDSAYELLPSSKSIQIFLGSDMLQQRQADVLFSSNVVTLFDDERTRLSIPLVRPENAGMFKVLNTSSYSIVRGKRGSVAAPQTPNPQPPEALVSFASASDIGQMPQDLPPPSLGSDASDNQPILDNTKQGPALDPQESTLKLKDEQIESERPLLQPLDTPNTEKDASDEPLPASASSRSGTSQTVWGNWRTGAASAGETWANASRSGSSTYQRPTRDLGIKVLKPSSSRQSSRNPATTPQSATAPQSRFFDEGRRRVSSVNPVSDEPQLARTTAGENGRAGGQKEGTGSVPAGKTRNANPVGGASAFGWLTSGQK